jgi:alkylation response protein AidB-like acyl-CoA dehydrogenase
VPPSAESIRRIPQETIDELHAAGLMRLMQPARFGGSELGLDAMMNCVNALAQGCASTAWVYSNPGLAWLEHRAAGPAGAARCLRLKTRMRWWPQASRSPAVRHVQSTAAID